MYNHSLMNKNGEKYLHCSTETENCQKKNKTKEKTIIYNKKQVYGVNVTRNHIMYQKHKFDATDRIHFIVLHPETFS